MSASPLQLNLKVSQHFILKLKLKEIVDLYSVNIFKVSHLRYDIYNSLV